jgi:hypothetical protein
MSPSEARAIRFAELASELAALCAEVAEATELTAPERESPADDPLGSVPDDALGQVIASVVRVYAAKAQSGRAGFPFARNSAVTDTDVLIACTAMLDGIGLNPFELGMWQDMSGIGLLDSEVKKRARGG